MEKHLDKALDYLFEGEKDQFFVRKVVSPNKCLISPMILGDNVPSVGDRFLIEFEEIFAAVREISVVEEVYPLVWKIEYSPTDGVKLSPLVDGLIIRIIS